MPVDGGGNVTRPGSPLPITGQTADAPQVNVPVDDIYAVLNQLAFLDGRKNLRGNIPMNGYRAVGAADAVGMQDYVTLGQLQSIISTFGTVPTGAIMPFTGISAPTGWVRANGSTLTRSTFPNLWSFAQSSGNLASSEGSKTLGQYGPGNGSTTFTVPNLEADGGYFLRPVTAGRGVGSVQADDFKSHNHGGKTGSSTTGAQYQRPSVVNQQLNNGIFSIPVFGSWQTLGVTNDSHDHAISSQGGSETRPKNIAYIWIIKA